MENKNPIQLEIYTGVYMPKITQHLETLGNKIGEEEDPATSKEILNNVDHVYTLLERIVQDGPLDERGLRLAMHPTQYTLEVKGPFEVSLDLERDYTHFGDALRYMRKQVQGLSQTRLAKNANLSSRTIHRTESGLAPGRTTVESLLGVLELKPDHTPKLYQLRLGDDSERTVGELLEV